ncbi:MAG: hypothetical protein GXO25_03035 [Euryarchaeota archaeon]|nr:hypothetical protein [Euryarchaeota archaeon]
MLVDRIAEEYSALSVKVLDYAIGPKYGYVEVEMKGEKSLGVAYFPSEDMMRGYADVPTATMLPKMLASPNMFNRTLAIAMLNAISQIEMRNVEKKYENLIDYVVRHCRGKKIAVVGNMGPIVRNLQAHEVYVFERNPRIRVGAYPDTMERRLLPQMDGVIISGTTLLNDTFDEVIVLSSNAKFRALVGPTAGVHPRFLRGVVDVLAGLEVVNAEMVKELIRRGGGRWDFTPYCREYVIETESII